MSGAVKAGVKKGKARGPVLGVFATGDPRIDQASRRRARNIVAMAAEVIAERVKLPDGSKPPVVWSDVLVDGERQADQVARSFRDEQVDILVCVPDTWAFPQLSLLSLLAHFPADTPLLLACGNSAPKPGVVFTHAANGALAQAGRLAHIVVGKWPDLGDNPKMTAATAAEIEDWLMAAIARVGLRGRRVAVFGHDSMGMETALAHVIPTRDTFGLEIARLDMKLAADLVNKKSYDAKELAALRAWVDKHLGPRLEIQNKKQSANFDQCLAMYLVVRDILDDLDAVGGGFMSQLEWGSDRRGIPMGVADVMESLFNSTFDHRGRKPALPFATEADAQGLLTMLGFTWLTGGNPPLFMDFRKVWEAWELKELAARLNVQRPGTTLWEQRGIVDGDNSGSASLDWAGLPGAKPDALMKRVSMPLADENYFCGLGNSVTFVSPGGIEGIAGRLAYSALSGKFSLVWDEATTVDLPEKLAAAVCNASNPTWPHTFITPKYATMSEYKHYAPANHLHMTWGLKPARVQYWLDLCNVLSATPWAARPSFVEGVDRPVPLLYILNGGENAAKMLR